MKLKSLELQGFKSFPDRTVLNFNSGATIVVGPNGSGKSNISDAIRWVLGETSAKGVRGSKMEDVIFSGSNSRRAMSSAEVSLILDNSSESGRIPDCGDEIVVTRRCIRGGESEYLIDRKPARLKDITELFMNTGVGRSGYSIIGQGKISEIVSQKSEDRRTIFEEAAGISKYRFRKNEAERKMNTVTENMTRAGDILRELESRVAPLEKAAEKARRYLQLYEEKKRIDVSLWIFDVETIRRKVNELSDSVAVAKRVLDEADGELSALEAKNERLYNESQTNKIKIESVQKKIRENSERVIELEGSVRVINTEIEHQKQRRSEAELNRSMHGSAYEESLKNLSELKDQLAELRKSLEEFRAEYERRLADTEELKQKRLCLEEFMSGKDSLIRGNRERLVSDKLKLSEISGFSDSSVGRREELNATLEELRERNELLQKRYDKADVTISDYTNRLDVIRKKCAHLKSKNENKAAEIENLRDSQGRLVSDYTSKKQRADTLRRMEEHFEGYSNSVRFVMDNSERGKLTGIFGPVSRMIDVPSKYSVAVETALGSNVQNIIVENENSAKEAISLLKKNGAGRATFYPVSSVKAQPLNIDMNQLEKYRGYIGIASGLIRCYDRCKNVIEYMLGRTVVFDNLSNATECARSMGYRVRIVTLDGQLINAGGSFTGGSTKRDSGMLTRAQEIARFEGEAEKIGIELTANREAIASIQKELDETARELEENEQNLNVLNTLIGAEKSQQLVIQSQLDGDKELYNKTLEALDELKIRDERNAEEKLQLEEQIRSLTDELLETEKQREELEKQHSECNKAISDSIEHSNSQLIKITQVEKEIEGKENNIELSENSVRSLLEAAERDSENIKSADESCKMYADRLTEMSNQMEALKTEAGKLGREHDDLINEGIAGDAALSKLRNQVKEESHRRENLFRAYTELDSKLEQTKSEQDKLSSKLWDEYELTYATAVALNYPPVTEQTRARTSSASADLKNKIRALGSVSLDSIDEYKEVSERAEFMRQQYDDLCVSKNDLEKIIDGLETDMKKRFLDVMAELDSNFKATFRELFGGGTAELRLIDPCEPLTCGIEINVAPPGKIVKSMSLLSGGEQSFVAIALFFAILNVNPTPFAVLDEIEAALDDVNVARFADYIKRYSEDTQFVVITHRRGTMEIADTLYGVTMPERGISRVLTLSIFDVENKLGVKIN